MPVGRIDDEDDELVDDSLNAGLLPGEATSPEGGSCSRPLCFGALLIGLLAFGVRVLPVASARPPAGCPSTPCLSG
jgi:hypothetical protein